MKIMKKIAAAAVSVAVFAATAVSVFADYTYSLDNTELVSEIQADNYTINGTEGTFEKNDLQAAETDDAISMRFSVFNEYLEKTYWDDPNVVVSVDVKLETEGVDVMGFIAGFDRGWKWINPSNYVTLKTGEWVTVSETGPHFQEVWGKRGPNQFMFQVRSNWEAGAQGAVKVSIKDFRITDGDGNTTVLEPEDTTAAVTTSDTTPATTTTAETTTTADTTAPEETEPAEVQTSDTEQASEETAPTEETPAATTAATTPDTTVSEATAATTIQTAATEAAAPDMSQIVLERPDAKKDTTIVIVVVVAVVVVVIAAIVIGYIIYKKKMFY